MDQRILSMFHRYCKNQLHPEEIEELVNYVNQASDEDLYSYLKLHWDEYEESMPLSEEKIRSLSPFPSQYTPQPLFRKFRQHWLHIAALFLLLISISLTTLYFSQYQEVKELAERNVEIHSGEYEPSTVVLPDGSEVRLNAKSTLSYSQNFGQEIRLVKLSGEGLFKVKHNEMKKFIVSTDYMNITVLGTTFNVYAYEKKDFIEMSLIEGLVKITTTKPPFQQIQVHPNEKIIYNKQTDQITFSTFNNQVETAWAQKELAFYHETMNNVFKCLERKFGINIIVENSELLKDLYTGVFDKENIESILRILQMHYGFTYRIEGSDIFIYNQ